MPSVVRKILDAFTPRERQIFNSVSLVFIVSLVLGAANIFYNTTTLTPIEGGSYVEGVVGQPIAVNPLLVGTNEADRDLVEALFSDLTELTEEYKVSEDERTWNIILKKDLLWSNGEPLTAEDVIFTIETIQNVDANSPLFPTWQGVVVERLSEIEIRLSLKTPYAFFLDNLEALKIVPQHIFGAIPGSNLRLSDYNLEPVGSGPYTFVNFEKRKDGFIKTYSLTANEHYSGETALIKDLTFQFFPDYEEAISAFNKREIDGLGGLAASNFEDVRIGHTLKELRIPRYYAIFFNSSVAPALEDKNVRRALTVATDKNSILEEALKKQGIIMQGPIHPNIEGYDPAVGAREMFSLEDAAEILEEDNWTKDEDGIRSKGIDGEIVRLSFELIVPDIDFLVDTANLIRETWGAIGVELIPIILSPSEIASEVIATRNYHMILFGNILKGNPDIFSFWHSSERFRSGLNLAFYEDKTVDALLESVRRTFDAETRIEGLHDIQAIIEADQPAIFLFSPSYLYAAPKALGGFDAEFIIAPSNRFDNIAEWYLKTARIFK